MVDGNHSKNHYSIHKLILKILDQKQNTSYMLLDLEYYMMTLYIYFLKRLEFVLDYEINNWIYKLGASLEAFTIDECQ